jgi:hypothetical protein
MRYETSRKFTALMALLMERGLNRDDARLHAARLMESYSEYVSEWFETGRENEHPEGHRTLH